MIDDKWRNEEENKQEKIKSNNQVLYSSCERVEQKEHKKPEIQLAVSSDQELLNKRRESKELKEPEKCILPKLEELESHVKLKNILMPIEKELTKQNGNVEDNFNNFEEIIFNDFLLKRREEEGETKKRIKERNLQNVQLDISKKEVCLIFKFCHYLEDHS